MKLKDICVLDVASCTPDLSVIGAARMMRQQHTGNLIVVDNDEDRTPVGIVTDRDIVLEVLAVGRDPATTAVHDIMARKLVIAGDTEDTSQALERMRTHGVRRIPIVGDRGRLVGVVSLDDILKLHAEQAAALLQIVAKEQNRESRGRR